MGLKYYKLTWGLNPRSYTQIHTRTVVRGGGGVWRNPSPEFFGKLQYFETIFPSLESLWSSQQDDAQFIGGGAAGGLWRRQQWSPSWTLPRIRNEVKTAINKHFALLHPKALFLLLKEVEKKCIFTQKWLDHLLLVTSYLVTIATDHR